MARTAPVSFMYHSGPLLKPVKRLAVDSQTWAAGQPYEVVAGKVRLAPTDCVRVHGIFAKAQATSTSTTTVECLEIQDNATKFIAYTSADDNDSAVAYTNEGCNYGIHVDGSRSTVNLSETTAVCFHVDSAYHTLETGKALAADNPGRVVGWFLAAVVDAIGT